MSSPSELSLSLAARLFDLAARLGISRDEAIDRANVVGTPAAIEAMQDEILDRDRRTRRTAAESRARDKRKAPIVDAYRRGRRWSGELDPEVYSTYFPVPLAPGLTDEDKAATRALIKAMIAAMPGDAIRVAIGGWAMAEKTGRFDMSADEARSWHGVLRKSNHGDRSLALVVAMGLFERETSGRRDHASSYRVVHWHPGLHAQAMGAIREARLQRRRRGLRYPGVATN